MVLQCCVALCKNNQQMPNVSFHNFTKDPQLVKVWLQKIRRDTVKSRENPRPFRLSKWTKICGVHFKRSDFLIRSEKNVLKANAVPTIFQWTDVNGEVKDSITQTPAALTLTENNVSVQQSEPEPDKGRSMYYIKYEEDVFYCGKMVPNDYKCNLCTFKSALKIEFHDHSVRVHNRAEIKNNITDIMKKWNCENCNFQTYSFLVLYQHRCKPWGLKMETKAKDSNTTTFDCANILQLYKCTKCDFYTNLKILFKSHVNQVHKERTLYDSSVATASRKSYSCEKCNFKTFSILVLYKHVCPVVRGIYLFHAKNVKPFRCTFCGFETKRKDTLTSHTRFKHRIRIRFKCAHCESHFVKKLHLKKHIERQHTVKNRKWDHCEHCDFKAKSVGTLKNHMRAVHALEVCFKCEHCHSRFAHMVQLKKHMKLQHTVSNAKWFQCDYCKYFTTYSSHMRKHLLRQHPKKSELHQCNRCDYKTELKSNLTKHWELEHTVNCMYCEQIFMLTSELRKHVALKHSIADENAKPFHCQHCDFKARFAISLKTHMFQRHKDNQIIIIKGYKCEQCGKAFRLQADLKRHESQAHSIRVEKCNKCKTDVVPGHTDYRLKREHCENTFFLKTDLEGHVLEVHSNRAGRLLHRLQREDQIPYLPILKEHDYSIQPYSYISSSILCNDVTKCLQVGQETGNQESVCIKPTVKL